MDTFKINIKKSNRRTLSLSFSSKGEIIVRAPSLMPDFMIRRFIQKNQTWIEQKLAEYKDREKKGKKDGYYLFLGKEYKFSAGDYKQIEISGNKLLFPIALLFRKEKELEDWYIRQARKIITLQVEKYAIEMDASYREVIFSDTRSQWGRCTHDNRLQFSWRLVMAPMLVINYVVIHELSHTFEKNHTQFFWMKVRNYSPSYKQQIKWLKLHGESLYA